MNKFQCWECYIQWVEDRERDGNLDGDQIMATTLEIIRGISQAAANAYDGAHDEGASHSGVARPVGLKREEAPH